MDERRILAFSPPPSFDGAWVAKRFRRSKSRVPYSREPSELQPELNCFITLCAEKALARAKYAEHRIMTGEPLRILEGIPFTVKDIVNTKDVRTTFGAIPYADNVPDHDAVAVARLCAAGCSKQRRIGSIAGRYGFVSLTV